jgi:hypothetical protein
MNWLYDLTQDELVDYVLVLLDEIDSLELKLKQEQQRLTDKINKDFEDNKKMVANIFKEVVKNDTERKITSNRRED